MIRISSMSNIKKSNKKNMENRTTKTKGSASKPDLLRISLARNKNNANPSLFNSVKKNNNKYQNSRDDKQLDHQYRSEKKPLKLNHNKANILEQLNTKISLDYINSLYSDLGVQFGFRIKEKIQNKQNVLGDRNINLNVILPSKEQRQCYQKIKKLIHLKDQINSRYGQMKNTQNLVSYIVTKIKTQNSYKDFHHEINSIEDMHQQISNFLKHFKSTQKQLEQLEHHYENYSQQVEQQEIYQNQNEEEQDQQQIDSIMQNLRNQIANQKKLCLRYEREQKFLINKLYFTQKKNMDLGASSSNLKIKNSNLKDTLKFSLNTKSTDKYQSPKPQRSFSMKLQRVKRFKLDQDLMQINDNTNNQRQLIRSRSASTLNSARRLPFFKNQHKQTLLDKIY